MRKRLFILLNINQQQRAKRQYKTGGGVGRVGREINSPGVN